MTTMTLEERLRSSFHKSARSLAKQVPLPERYKSLLEENRKWAQSGGRFGQQLIINDTRPASVGHLFKNHDLDVMDFSGARLTRASFGWCNLRFASFVGTRLEDLFFQGCDLEGADFSKATLVNVRFLGCADYDKANFTGVVIPNHAAGIREFGRDVYFP